eukprot:5826660-Prymnesium_polylepis.1
MLTSAMHATATLTTAAHVAAAATPTHGRAAPHAPACSRRSCATGQRGRRSHRARSGHPARRTRA